MILIKNIFCGEIELIQLMWSHFILSRGARFYKLTIPQYPPYYLQEYSTCNSARLEFLKDFFIYGLIQNMKKMVS